MDFEVGAVIEGKVTGITNFGAFVDLGEGKTGMVHVSEVSRSYVKDIKEFVKEGDTVKAKVINIDKNGKISLSMKQLQEDKRPPRREFKRAVFSGVPEKVDWSAEKNTELSFEEMMSKFKTRSEEKISDLKKNTDGKRGTSYRKR